MRVKTDLAAACTLLGLSAPDLAALADVRLDTAKSWMSGRRTPPPDVWDTLAVLYRGGNAQQAEAMLQRAIRRLRGGPVPTG